jgi:hypothetical protein
MRRKTHNNGHFADVDADILRIADRLTRRWPLATQGRTFV